MDGIEVDLHRAREENARLRIEIVALKAMAYRDEASGLWNRRYFDERLLEELSRIRRHPGRQLSILVADLNNLKRINDTFGHHAGDEAIRWLATFLQRSVRLVDLCCRWGGDEFALILPDTDAAGRQMLAQRLVASCRKLAPLETPLPIAFAIGGATGIEDGATPEALLATADRRMYHHKKALRRDPWQRLEQQGRTDDPTAASAASVATAPR